MYGTWLVYNVCVYRCGVGSEVRGVDIVYGQYEVQSELRVLLTASVNVEMRWVYIGVAAGEMSCHVISETQTTVPVYSFFLKDSVSRRVVHAETSSSHGRKLGRLAANIVQSTFLHNVAGSALQAWCSVHLA
jgi:hypothetical protein